MNSIISYLVLYNQFLITRINQLVIFIVKNIPLADKKDNHFSPKYKKLNIDKLPIIKKLEVLDYKQLLTQHLDQTGKVLKPINSRGGTSVPTDVVCLHCGAPHHLQTAPLQTAGGCWQRCRSGGQ